MYSGKKGYHTVKNTVISDKEKFIHFLGLTTQGSMHDYELLRLEFDPSQSWFAPFECLVDLGYQGFEKEFECKSLQIPIKKAKNKELTGEQKELNRQKSKLRIKVEHAICGIKRWSALVERYRNRKDNFEDAIIRIAAGIWNLYLKIT